MFLFKSTISRRTSSTLPKSRLNSSHRLSQCDFSKLKRKTNCRSKPRTKSSIIFLLLIGWVIIAIIYLFWIKNPLKNTQRQLFGKSVEITPTFYIKNVDDYSSFLLNKEIIYTNIGIVIPSYFNEYTIKYMDRILHNIYLSQIDFEPISNKTNNKNNIYYPSQVIISMSIMSSYYEMESNLTNILNEYRYKYLNDNKQRLKIIYHHNITMNAAENRNYGLSKINESITDYIGFFDIDDIMHPQRIGILYYILNGNKKNIDFIFHSFIMHKHCKEKNIQHNYLNDFKGINNDYLNKSTLKYLSHSISDNNLYTKDFCVAYNKKSKRKRKKNGRELSIFNIECNDKNKRIQLLMGNPIDYNEIFKFDRYYHNIFGDITYINYSQLISSRCLNKKTIFHPISGKGLHSVSCEYGTMAQGLEAFRNQRALTRHHNGWPTMKIEIAKQLKYDEKWNLHGSYRGQDSGFNTNAYKIGAKIFHIGYYLGMYCYH